MDDPAANGSVAAFLAIAAHLRESGYSAPQVYHADVDAGLVLLEDLGDDSFACMLEKPDPARERMLYEAAIDVLIDLHGRPIPPDLPRYDADWLLRDAALLLETYAPLRPHRRDAALRRTFESAWMGPLVEATQGPAALSLRDFHAGNLMWLPARAAVPGDPRGVRRVGLLDFQDARIAPIEYDIVSLLEDARRTVAPALAEAMVRRYLAARPDINESAFRTRYAILGAQRNTRIVAVFSRLAARDAKPHYLTFLPRVLRHLAHDLSHPALADVARWFGRWLPHIPEQAA